MEGSAATTAAPTTQEEKKPQPGNFVSAGKSVAATVTRPGIEQEKQQDDNAAGAAATTNGQQTNNAPTEVEVPELTDDQIKKLFDKKGIKNFDGNFEELGKKLAPVQEKGPEPTPEEKAAAQTEREKNVLKFWLENGGTAEQIVAVKQILGADPKEFAISEVKRELREAEIPEDQIEEIMKVRYFQESLDGLEKGVDETDEEFDKRKTALEKKIAFGTKKLESKGQYTRKQAQDLITRMEQAYDAAQSLAAEEVKFSSKVDEHFQKVPREMTFELGELNKLKIDPVQFKVDEADVKEIQELLKDPVKRQQFFFNADNSLNLTNMAEVLLRSKSLDKALKAALLEGGSREVAKFEKVFPGSFKDLGVGGQRSGNGVNGRAGVPASYGKPEPVKRQ